MKAIFFCLPSYTPGQKTLLLTDKQVWISWDSYTDECKRSSSNWGSIITYGGADNVIHSIHIVTLEDVEQPAAVADPIIDSSYYISFQLINIPVVSGYRRLRQRCARQELSEPFATHLPWPNDTHGLWEIRERGAEEGQHLCCTAFRRKANVVIM